MPRIMKWSMTTGCSFLQSNSTYSSVEISMGCRWLSAPTCSLMASGGQSGSPCSSPWAIGGYLLQHDFAHELQGTVSPSSKTLSPSLSSLTLASEELFLPLSHTSLIAAAYNLLPFLKCIVT